MNICDLVSCPNFPCQDVNHAAYYIPTIDLDPSNVRLVLISECAAPQTSDHYYAGSEALFAQTTLLAFQDAGLKVDSIDELLARGIYFTTAIKCAKTAYAISRTSVETCSELLAQELALFSNTRVYLLMGDVAIQALNTIARKAGEKRIIPAGATYKIRSGDFRFRDVKVFPSYLQAGASFFIEKSKRKMIAEDIREALKLI